MNFRNGPFRPSLFVLAILLMMLFAVACLTTPTDNSNSTQSSSSTASGSNGLRELRLFVEPRSCASYILDPQPAEGSRYAHGTPVTIMMVVNPDCQIKEWINVDSFSGNNAKINMNADRIMLATSGRTALPVDVLDCLKEFNRQVVVQKLPNSI